MPLRPPSWVASVLRRHKASMERLVGRAWLPENSIYGCGAFGCVLPTSDPRVVLKVTVDGSEALFAAAAIALGPPPPGIVPIYAVAGATADLTTLYGQRRKDQVFFLWRASVAHPLTSKDVGPEDRASMRRLFAVVSAFQDVWGPVESSSPDASVHDHENWARAQPDLAAAAARSSPASPAERASAAYLLLLRDLGPLTHDPLWGDLATAVQYYAERDLLLYDLDTENAGYLSTDRTTPPVLYDVGLTHLLSPRWASPQIPKV